MNFHFTDEVHRGWPLQWKMQLGPKERVHLVSSCYFSKATPALGFLYLPSASSPKDHISDFVFPPLLSQPPWAGLPSIRRLRPRQSYRQTEGRGRGAGTVLDVPIDRSTTPSSALFASDQRGSGREIQLAT